MTKVHVDEFVTNAPMQGIDELEYPEAPVVGDSIELPEGGIYFVRGRRWVMIENGDVHCRLFVES